MDTDATLMPRENTNVSWWGMLPPDGRKNKPLVGFLGQFETSFQVRARWLCGKVSAEPPSVTWEQSERSSDCRRSDTKHVLCHYPGHHSLLTRLALQMKPPLFLFFSFFLFLPELHHVPAACKAFVKAHKAAIVAQKRTRREKDGGCYSRSDQRSQSVLLRADDKKGKARGVG